MARGQLESTSTNRTRAFASLEAQTRFVSESRIRKQWRKVPEGVQTRVFEVLREIERTGLVQKRHRTAGRNAASKEDKDDVQTIEKQQGIEELVRLIDKRLSRMPFPPSTQETDFDYELLLNKNRAIESQITANTHSMNLLRAEIEKEKKSLAQDKQDLKALEDALRDTEVRRRKQAKNFHPLAKTVVNQSTKEPIKMEAGLASDTALNLVRSTDLQALQDDPEMGGLLQQLRSHLESMDNNTSSVRGMVDSLSCSQAFLDILLPKMFNQSQLAQIYSLQFT